jgi:two-component sensor histidine kinase
MQNIYPAEAKRHNLYLVNSVNADRDLGKESTSLASHLRALAEIVERRSQCDPTLANSNEMRRDSAASLDATAAVFRLLVDARGARRVNINDVLARACAAVTETTGLLRRVHFTMGSESGCFIPAEAALPLSGICVEVLTNAIWHAHPTGVVGSLSVSSRRDADGSTVVEIADDGVGLPEGFDTERDGGAGLGSVREWARQIGAAPEFSSAGLGLTFRLRMPAASLA